MKMMNMFFTAMAFVFTAQMASANSGANYESANLQRAGLPIGYRDNGVQEPLWNCALTFDIKGGGLKVLVGQFKLEGYGQISCMDIAGNTEEIPVYVRMGGTPLSLGLGIGKMRLVGLAAGIGITGEPRDLLGRYLVAGMRGSLVIGGGADLAMTASDRALTLNTSVQAVSGFGANIGLDFMTIQAL